ncbi:MAG TPA: FHA domain-containing protein [Myxococcota bacterium]|nr:FHA domain-containing protein [Myxococcota bacterium]
MAGDSRKTRGVSVLQVSFYYDGEFYGTECFTQRRLVIGRGPDADIRIECDLISRVHAVLRIVGERIIVEDLSSRNGIRVNNRAVRRAPLGNWDSLALGAYLLKFHLHSYQTRRTASQLEVLQMPSDPDWESTDEVTALPLQLEAEPTFDMPLSLLPPIARPTRPATTKVSLAPGRRLSQAILHPRRKTA